MRYAVRSAMARGEGPPYGFIVTDDDGVVTGYEPVEARSDFGQYDVNIVTKDKIEDLVAQYKMDVYTPVTDGDDDAQQTPKTEDPVEKTSLSDLIAQSRANRGVDNPVEDPVDGDEVEFDASGDITKADAEQQIVYGWAYVTHDKDGAVVVDKSGDFIDQIAEVEKSAIHFMLNSRQGDVGHTNVKSTDIVESVVFTPEKCEAMGIAKGTLPSGWWIGAKCDDATWARYKSGELKAFSIHGKGTRSKVEQ